MKNLVIAIFTIFCYLSAQSQQILPATVYCMKGSTPHPVSYCADSTPCKVINGKNVCLTGTPNPPAGSVTIPNDCWSMSTDYTCLQYVSDCATYSSDSACTEVGAKECSKDSSGNLMLSTIPKLGQCSSYTRSFSCVDPSKPSSTSTTYTTSCDTNSLMDNLNWSTTSPSASQDFVMAATSQEFARQIAVYSTKDGSIMGGLFPGKYMDCTDGWGGIKSCCSTDDLGPVSNRSLASTIKHEATTAALQYVWEAGSTYAVQAGSQFVYDSIYGGISEFMTAGMDAMLANGAMFGSFTTAAAANAAAAGLAQAASDAAAAAAANAAGAAGAAAANASAAAAAAAAGTGTAEAAAAAAALAAETAATSAAAGAAAQTAANTATTTAAAGVAGGVGAFGFGTTASSAAGMFATSSSSMAIGNTGLFFNPYALVIALVIMAIMAAMSCSEAEHELAGAKKLNLCHYVGNFCSQNGLFGCTETSQTYCCYNGLLGKAIEEGAHAQLGLSWGSGEAVSCGGLTADQITSLDFSSPAMVEALKPFQAQIMADFNNNAGAALSNGTIQTAAQSKATTNAAALCIQRQKLDPKTVCN